MAFKPPPPTPKGLFRRTPPAIFPPILGLMALGLAWRRGAGIFGVPAQAAELLLGAVTMVFLFAAVAYLAKFARRPGVLQDELQILPGHAGVASLVLCSYLLAAILAPYAPDAGTVILWATLVLHAALIALSLAMLLRATAAQRRVTPVWHLVYAGPVVGALVAQGLGHAALWQALAALAAASALLIWAASARQFARERVPAPLRPLLAIHLTPAAILTTILAQAGMPLLATGLALALALLFGVLALSSRWLLAAGFSPLWGALTFPLAAIAQCCLALGGLWLLPGALMLALATLVIPAIAWRILRKWATGGLAIKTNAAVA
jgi:tellurite resistance protein